MTAESRTPVASVTSTPRKSVARAASPWLAGGAAVADADRLAHERRCKSNADRPQSQADSGGCAPHRILVVDDNAAVLDGFRKILTDDADQAAGALEALEASLLATDLPEHPRRPSFIVDLVQDGEEGCKRALNARSEGAPYAVAFVDMRMPGGWDGLSTIEELWRCDPDVQVVLCTAFSDYSWDEIVARLGNSDRLLILRKPFETIEVLQLACSLAEKWCMHRERRAKLDVLEQQVEKRTRYLRTALGEQRRAEQELDHFFTLTPDVLCVVGRDSRFKRVNPASRQVLGYPPDELKSQRFTDVVCPEDREQTLRAFRRVTAENEKLSGLTIRSRVPDGSLRWIEWSFVPNADRGIVYCTGRDVTESHAADATRKRLAAVLEGTTDIIYFADPQGRVLYLNRMGRELFGTGECAGAGKSVFDFYPPRAGEILRTQGLPGAVRQGRWRGETFVARPNGQEIPVSQVIEAQRSSTGKIEFYSAILRDISDRKAYEEKLQHQATHDPLTGLPNRSLFTDRLGQAVVHAIRRRGRFAVCFIDLDRFKWINDSLGHEAGDELLRTVADRMSACLRECDTIARIGGDEFVILLSEVASGEEAMIAVRRLMDRVSEPMSLCGQKLSVTCSVGCSIYPDDGSDSDALLKFADLAMYRAKETGRNNAQVYNAELRGRLEERVRLEGELRGAIERNEFLLHYQPQVCLRTGRIIGVEALLRWQHPELGLVPPGRFIPIAEETGLIAPIGEWVLRTACRQSAAWQRTGLPPVRIAVNVSAKQLCSLDLATLVTECLSNAELDPAYLELELTESATMEDPDAVIPLMNRLRDLGVYLSIDDFGTGYSNMHYLQRFPIDKLKLDGSFVKQITSNPGSLAIADAIIAMAHRLGIKVVAEMAETEGEVALLAARGCDQVQGYYFSRPLPADRFAELLQAGKLSVPQSDNSCLGRPRLLVADDDPKVTSTLARLLATEDREILLAHRVEEAFELLARHEVGVILCGQRLQETTGVEFLSQARRLHPRTVRLMFTGSLDAETAMTAINHAAVYKFLAKPCSNKELRAALADGFDFYERATKDRVQPEDTPVQRTGKSGS